MKLIRYDFVNPSMIVLFSFHEKIVISFEAVRYSCFVITCF